MSSASAARSRAKKKKQKAAAGRRLPVYGIIVGTVVVLFVAAILMTRSGDSNDGSPSAAGVEQTRAVTVTGDALPEFTEGEDAAVGMPLPEIRGKSFEGDNIAITNDGRPKVLIMLAHWCPHCQFEVPVVQDWINKQGMPEDADIYSIATGTTSSQPNYPPSEWLEREGWTAPVLADDTTYSAATSLGLTNYPYFVFVNSDGTVAQRLVGRQPVTTIVQAILGLN